MDLSRKKILAREIILFTGLIALCLLLERKFFDFGHLILGSKHFLGKSLWIYKPIPLTLDIFTFTPIYVIYILRLILWLFKISRIHR